MLRPAEAMVRIMVTKDPRRSADTILQFLIRVNGAAGASLFGVEPELRLFLGSGIGQEDLDWVAERWQRAPVMRRGPIALLLLKAGQVDMGSLSEVFNLTAEGMDMERIAWDPGPSSLVES